LVTLAPILLTAAFAFGSPEPASCPVMDSPPALRVDIDIAQPEINHSQSRAQLKQFNIATPSPYGHDSNVHVNGLMRGSIGIQTKLELSWQRNDDESVNCTWFQRVDIKLTLKPTIYIAREILKNSCMYREVLNHEYKHYKTDYDIAQDYRIIFQKELGDFIRQTGVIGPYGKEQQKQVKNDMAKHLEKRIEALSDRIKFERIKRQSAIDSRTEYDRVMVACKGEAASF
jgi:hypothetical protein